MVGWMVLNGQEGLSIMDVGSHNIVSHWRLALFALCILIAFPGLLQLRLHPDPSIAILPTNGPMAENYAHYLAQFPADYGALIVLKDRACSADTWARLNQLHGAVEVLPQVYRVISPINIEYVSGIADTVNVTRFTDIENITERCKQFYQYPPVQDLLVEPSEHVFALHITANHPVTAADFTLALRQAIDRSLDKNPLLHQRIYITGELIMSHELMVLTQADSGLLAIALVLMFIVVGGFTRSLTIALITIFAGALAVLFTLALMGYLGVPQSPVNGLMINMLIPLGAAFTVHASNYQTSQGILPTQAVAPFLFATLTTLFGFGLTCLNGSPEVRSMGLLGTFGIAASLFVVCFFTFPVLRLVQYEPKLSLLLTKAGERLTQLNLLPKPALIGVVLILCLGTGIGLSQIRVDYSPIDYFEADNPVRQDSDRVEAWFGRYGIPVMVTSGDENSALSPGQWLKVNQFISVLEARYPGLETAWLFDQISTMHQAFNADLSIPVAYPSSANLMAQYLLLFNPEDIAHYLSVDRDQWVFRLQVSFKSAQQYLALKSDLMAFGEENNINLVLTGRVDGFFETGQNIAWDNLSSLGWGVLLLLGVFTIYLRSIKTALIVVFVNALPVLICFAMLGLLDIPLDFGASVVATIALGLVLDDTGHLLAKYRHYRAAGYVSKDAADRMVSDLRGPVILTTITIVVGFSVMNFAQIVPFHTFSLLLAAALSTACIADLVLLPALLSWSDKGESVPTLRVEHPGIDESKDHKNKLQNSQDKNHASLNR